MKKKSAASVESTTEKTPPAMPADAHAVMIATPKSVSGTDPKRIFPSPISNSIDNATELEIEGRLRGYLESKNLELDRAIDFLREEIGTELSNCICII